MIKKMNETFPSNSFSSKQKQLQEPKNLQKIVKGVVKQKKPSLFKDFAHSFIETDGKSIGDYIIYDVLIPSAKNLIYDIIQEGLSMTLFGGRQGRRTTRDGNTSRVNYGAQYRSTTQNKPTYSINARASHKFDEIILDSRGAAEEVLSSLVDLTIDYKMASVADLYVLVGITPSFTDDKYGWTDLRNASVSRVRDGYILNLPRTTLLD